MSDLVAFLRARLSEDEGAAREVLDAPDAAYSAEWNLPFSATIDLGDDTLHTNDQRVARHIARWDPARVLAEVEAKRQILAVQERALNWHPAATPTCPSNPRCACAHCIVVRILAQPYVDHPDFDLDWRR